MKKLTKKILLITSFIAMTSSCAFSPSKSKEEMKSETSNFELPYVNQTKDVLVYVIYPSKSDSTAKFNIFVDGKKKDFKVGNLKSNQFTHFFVKAGTHEIFSKGKKWASVKIDGTESSTIFVKQVVFESISDSKNNLEIIDEIEAKYYIKNSSESVVKEKKMDDQTKKVDKGKKLKKTKNKKKTKAKTTV